MSGKCFVVSVRRAAGRAELVPGRMPVVHHRCGDPGGDAVL